MKRPGLSPQEAALVWAAASFGAPPALLERLEAPSRQPVARCLERLEALSEEARQAVLVQWAEQDTGHEALLEAARTPGPLRAAHLRALDERWRRVAAASLGEAAADIPDARARQVAGKLALRELLFEEPRLRPELVGDPEEGFDLGHLCVRGADEIMRFALRLGCFQIAEVWRRLDRRQLARELSQLGGQVRAWLLVDLRAERELPRAELARIQELVVKLSQRHSGRIEQIRHVGLYFLALSGGRRHAARVERLARRLPPPHDEALRAYARLNRTTTRRGLEQATRRSIRELLARWSLDGPASPQEIDP